MNDLIKYKKESINSLELLEQINFFRVLDGNKAELRHDTLRDIIKDEFEEEILSQKILEKSISSTGGRPTKIFELTLSQAKQVLVRESKAVRRAVIHQIEKLENQIKELEIKEKENLLISYKEAERRKKELEYLTGDGKYLKAIPYVEWLKKYFWMDKNGVIPRLNRELILLSNERRIPYDTINSRVFGGEVFVFHIDIYRAFKEILDKDTEFGIMPTYRRIF